MSHRFNNLLDPRLFELVDGGAVGVILTDTVYGLVAKAASQDAVTKLYAVKPRESAPGTIIAASVDDLAHIGFRRPDLARANKFWPGPLSMVIDATGVADYIRQGRTSLAVRIPKVEGLRRLLDRTGPLMTTSANLHGSPASTSVEQAHSYFGDSIDYYVNSGSVVDREPSTIAGYGADGRIEVYRVGAFPVPDLYK